MRYPALLIVAASLLQVSAGRAAAEQDYSTLAARCNEAGWHLSSGSYGLPTIALAGIVNELLSEGPACMGPISKSLPRSVNLRRVAPQIVANWPSDESRSILITLLDDKDEIVAMNAAHHLGIVGGQEVYEPLRYAVDHSVPMVRQNALNALSALGQSNYALDAAIGRLDDKEKSFVVSSAIGLIEKVEYTDNSEKALSALRSFKDATYNDEYKAMAERAIEVVEITLR